MKTITKLVIAGILAVGAAGCADTYYDDYGYDYVHHSDGYYYHHDSFWRDGRRYCRMADGDYELCGSD
jgi:hypothetical protein